MQFRLNKDFMLIGNRGFTRGHVFVAADEVPEARLKQLVEHGQAVYEVPSPIVVTVPAVEVPAVPKPVEAPPVAKPVEVPAVAKPVEAPPVAKSVEVPPVAKGGKANGQ